MRPLLPRSVLSIVALFPLLIPVATLATTWHVPSQCPTIQAGIDSASAGDTVLVACGTYYEHDIIMKSGICLRSETGQPECVVIDAEQQGRVVYCNHVDELTVIEGITLTRGHTVADSGGGMFCNFSSPKVVSCHFTNCHGRWGGGICCCQRSSPMFTSCDFQSNTATFGGGGLFCYRYSHPVLTECDFVENSATGVYCTELSSPVFNSCTFRGHTDGAVCCWNAWAPIFNSCTFSGNSCDGPGGGIFCYLTSGLSLNDCLLLGNSSQDDGGGIACLSSSPSMTDCVFQQNTADHGGGIACWQGSAPTLNGCVFSANAAVGKGGGMFCDYQCPVSLSNCTFEDNSATEDGGALLLSECGEPALNACLFQNNSAAFGGAVRASLSTLTLSYCTLAGNSAVQHGGALHFWYCDVEMSNCTLAGNSAQTSGGGVFCRYYNAISIGNTIIAFSTEGEALNCYDESCSATLMCCDVYGNSGGDWVGCIADQYGTYGNISEDPMFCDPDNNDFRLDCSSPCAPGYNPECGLIGAWDVGCGSTATKRESWSGLKALYR